MQGEIKKTLLDFVDYFNQNKIPYALVGGLAVNVWGRIRTTLDADLIIDHRKLDIKDFVDYLNERGYSVSLKDIQIGFSEKSHITIWSDMFRVDLKGTYNKFAKKTLKSALTLRLFGKKIRIDSPELVIISKLCYGSEQDFEDAVSIYLRLTRQDKLNLERLNNLVKKLGINDRLHLLKLLATEDVSPGELESLIGTLKDFDFTRLDELE